MTLPDLRTVEERRAEGRARRRVVPRSSHAGWRAPADRPDPIALLEARHRSRVPELVQAASDVFLGWADGPYGKQCSVRQLRDMKGSVSIDRLTPDDLRRYAMLCGVTRARAHARSGDPAEIAGYLGTGDQFDRALVAFADGYADQTAADHAALEQAVADGRIEAVRGR